MLAASNASLGAIITAMVTPFDADGRVNKEAAARLMRHLVDHGSDGVLVSGTIGEAPTLSDAERLELFELAVREVGERATIVAGTGSNDTAHAVELTRRAGELGVDAMLVVCPYYNKPPDRGLLEHYKAVAAATDKPILIYNIPGRCVINMSPKLIAQIGEIGNVVAVKQANADLEQAREIVASGSVSLYAGDDNLLEPFLELGGAGGVCTSSQVVGDQMQEIVQAFGSGEVERAREIDAGLQDVYGALFMTTGPILVKAALNLLGFEVGGLRLPLVEAQPDEIAGIKAMLERHGLLEPAAA